jgi:hypothetical protein
MSHRLSSAQMQEVRAAMKLFVQEDRVRGVPPDQQLYCAARRLCRPAAGEIQ